MAAAAKVEARSLWSIRGTGSDQSLELCRRRNGRHPTVGQIRGSQQAAVRTRLQITVRYWIEACIS